MRNYIDVAQDESGNALVGATCTVQQYPSGAPATIYSDNGLTPLGSNIVTTDVTGQFSFFAPDGDYILVLSVGGTPYKTQSPVTLFDGAAQLTFPDVGSAANVYATSSSDQEKALRAGLRAAFLAAHSNTGASTYSYNGLTAKPLVFPTAVPLVAGSITAGGVYAAEYDGTNWQMRNGALALPYYAATSQETTAAVTIANYSYPYGDMRRYGVQPNGVDNTAIVQSVFNMFKTAGNGGFMFFQPGDYSFYLDISGAAANVFIQGNGCNFRPFTATPTQSAVIFGNNSGTTVASAGVANVPTNFGGNTVCFFNCQIIGQKYTGGAVTGDVNCAMALYGMAVKCWNVSFEYGKVASFFGCYAQYSEFWSCGFYLSNLSATSAGCILTGYGSSSGSNEVEFIRCYFQSNAVALQILGAIKTRIYGCNMQGNGTAYPYGSGAVAAGVLVLGADGSGFGAINPTIEGVWFEANYAPHIIETGDCSNVRVHHCSFFGGGAYTCALTTTFTNDWSVNDNMVYATTMVCTFNYPSGSGGTAKLTFHGNNFVPILNLTHTGPYDLDIHVSGSFTGTLTGMTTVVTGTFNYTIDGQQWSMLCPGALTGTSNSTAFTVTGLPSILTPQTGGGAYISVPALEDNTTTAENVFASVSSTTLTFYKAGSPAGFTNAGSKGFLNPTIIQGNLF